MIVDYLQEKKILQKEISLKKFLWFIVNPAHYIHLVLFFSLGL